MQLDSFDKGIIDGDDLANALEEIVFGEIKAPGMRENGHVDDYADEIAEDKEVNEDKYGMIRHQLDKAAEKLQDGPLKGIPTDIVIDFIKTHIKDIRGASDEEIADEFENFRSVNYDYIDEDLKEQFKRFM